MYKNSHEFRDPIHVFIKLDADERKVVDSEPFQRLRHIHQLAMTYMVYPGATHRRFEHSLGCMELASRIFDTITKPENLRKLPKEVLDRLPEIINLDRLSYWRRTLRIAALCHDLGHLPFSHAAEDLLPEGFRHETITKLFILQEMQDICSKMEEPQLKPKQIAKIAVGQEESQELGSFSAWERILSEIITGEVFGADRMDYLLRDSLHIGVTYGHFDHHRLIDTMRILPGTAKDNTQSFDPEPELGVELGGMQVAESLLVARYLMFSQVYFHPVRRIYDLHLKEFLKHSLPGGKYSADLNEFLAITDNEIHEIIRIASKDSSHPGHSHAQCISGRKHFKKAYHSTTQACKLNPNILSTMTNCLSNYFGSENVIVDIIDKGMSSKDDFPILTDEGLIISAHGESKVLTSLPMATTGYVFVKPEIITVRLSCHV